MYSKILDFNGIKLSLDQENSFRFAKSIFLIFSYGVINEVSQYVKLIEKIYVSRRNYEELTPSGRIDFGQAYEEEIK